MLLIIRKCLYLPRRDQHFLKKKVMIPWILIESLEESGLLINGVSKAIKTEVKTTKKESFSVSCKVY